MGFVSPYEALYGRTPRFLDVMSHEDDSALKENAAEMRAIALRSMVQASAEDKIKRAERSRTRPAGELAELQVGDLVDIYRPTLSKDTPRWNGPATVCDLTSLRFNGVMRLGWIRKDPNWIACEGSKEYQDLNLQLLGVSGIRFGHNVKTISGVMCDESMICWWQPPDFQAGVTHLRMGINQLA